MEFETFYPKNRQEWRDWLQENHQIKEFIWLLYYKKKSGISSISYNDAVDEALCFGWIDSKAKTLDDDRYIQFFCKRKAKSVWSRINKEKVEKLIQAGQMTQSGFDSIELAKQNGSWIILDEVESLVVPADLQIEFEKNPLAFSFFQALSRTDKRNILQWLVLAKRAETRTKRINELIELGNQQLKPKQFR